MFYDEIYGEGDNIFDVYKVSRLREFGLQFAKCSKIARLSIETGRRK